MSNEQQFEITVAFPPWSQEVEGEVSNYSGHGVKYLFKTPVIPYPEWDDNDERWFSWSEEKVVQERFVEWYKQNIKGDFDGDILFIEPSYLVVADGMGDE